QALSLKWLAEHRDELETRVYDIPDSIDDEIGRAKLAAMGITIDVLTPEQEAYLSGWTAE
ncbi:MAG: adenosylhomocysteinase, partial [Lachnospiraceae bacterium]|nr:adenosylhomocysteinase [Lachnospiraceae bacterium]